MSQSNTSQPVPYAEVAALPYKPATRQVQYGPLKLQFAEYWQAPESAPLLLLIHGGCWLNQFDLTHIRPLASELAERGIAVLSIEYRRIGDAGGGWPGTFDDVTAALNYAAELGHENLFVAGHSAGGHLALWLNAVSDNKQLRGAVGLAAIADLKTYAEGSSSCERAAQQLMSGPPDRFPARYQQFSPIELNHSRPTSLIHGELDNIVRLDQSTKFCSQHVNCEVHTQPKAGHFDVIDPRQTTPDIILKQINHWLKQT